MSGKQLQTKPLTIDDLQFKYNPQQGAIMVNQRNGPTGMMEINTLLPPLLAQLVGRPINHFNIIPSRCSASVLAIAFHPIQDDDPVIPVPINCPSLIYPRSFTVVMRKFVDHILWLGNNLNRRGNLNLAKWYREGELLIEDVLDNINLLNLSHFDQFTFELIIKTTLAQPFRTTD